MDAEDGEHLLDDFGVQVQDTADVESSLWAQVNCPEALLFLLRAAMRG